MIDRITPALRAHARRLAIAPTLPRPTPVTAVAVLGVMLATAGAYGLRDTVAGWVAPAGPPPVATDRLAVTLPSPAPDAERPGATHRAAGDGDGDGDGATIVALARPDTLASPASGGGLPQMSPLSRIFRGSPPVTPPDRPVAGARAPHDTARVRPRPRPAAQPQPEAPQEIASLRPRPRPEALAVPAESRIDRPGPQAAPEAPAAVAPPLEIASLRPRQRPAALAVPAEPRTARPGPQTAPEAPAAAAPPRHAATIDTTPEIVRTSVHCPDHLSAAMPRRARDAAGGRAVLAGLAGVEGVTRDAHLTRAILSGNVPRFLRALRPVSLRGTAADGSSVVITLCVTPDYLAVGSDSDHARVPLGLRAASRIGGAFDMVLPTTRMVDLIHRAADLRLAPRPMPAGPAMRSTDYLSRHNATVADQIRQAGASPGRLISGHKKDIVLTPRLAERPGRVAIYGWHRANGEPIQPLSTVHGAGYADYSHGVRLVSRTAYLNGRPVDLLGLLASPRHAALLSDEGPVTGPYLRMAALAAN
jgi:hypothetical protein